jgi:hypothetical protein
MLSHFENDANQSGQTDEHDWVPFFGFLYNIGKQPKNDSEADMGPFNPRG